MSEFLKLEANAPATLGAVVEAVTRLSTYPEAELLELISRGQLKDLFPFRPTHPAELGPDSIEEGDLVEASAMPLSPKQHAALIESSLPPRSTSRGTTPRRAKKKAYSAG